MMDSQLDSNGGFTGDDPNRPPPGMRWDPATGTFVPIQAAPQIPLPPGATRDPNTGAVIFPPGSQSAWNPSGTSNAGLIGFDGNPIAAPAPPATPNQTGVAPVTTPSSHNDIFTAPLTKPFDGTFSPPAPVNLGGPAGIPYVPPTPVFTPPTYTPPPAFKFNAPTPEEALNDPGYKFRTEQGNRSLQNWAAAKGTLNDSSTAKALTDYGQGAATQEYANVWNRNWQDQTQTYDKNYQTQYADPYAIKFSGAAAAFAPQMVGYQTQAAAGQHTTDTNYLNSWNEFLNKQNYFTNWQDRVFQKQFATATA